MESVIDKEKPVRPALRYHGGKFRLAPWVMQFFPDHDIYTESFGGAAGILLQKPRARAEVYNDLDGEIVNFFRVVRNPDTRARLIDALAKTPYARQEFEEAYQPADCPVEMARRLCIRAQMGFGSAGATKGATGFRIDTRREYGTAIDLWVEYPDVIGTIGERMQGVLIENRPAINVMLQHDEPATLHYVDPPYLHDTRTIGNRYYRHEMTDDDHLELLHALKSLKGFVVLSGYPHPLYDDNLDGWEKHTTQARMSANRGTGIKTECLWINPACQEALKYGQVDMFAEG